MPRRLIRDGILTSERIDQLDANGERFYFRLLLVADDYGRFSADTRILRSSVFPLKDDVRTADIARLLTACEKAGLIRLYNKGEKKYLEIQDFRQTIRAKESKYPQPDSVCDADETHMRHICNAHVPVDVDEDEDEDEDEGEKYRARRREKSLSFDPISVLPIDQQEAFRGWLEVWTHMHGGKTMHKQQVELQVTRLLGLPEDIRLEAIKKACAGAWKNIQDIRESPGYNKPHRVTLSKEDLI